MAHPYRRPVPVAAAVVGMTRQRTSPPMTDDEIVDAATDAGFPTVGEILDPTSTPDGHQRSGHWDTWDAPLGGDDDPTLNGVRDGRWLRAQTFPALRFAVPGLIPEGFTLLIGPPKAGKSWLLLDMLLAVAAGGRALGTIPTGAPRRVLYLALEDGDRRMQSRCAHLLGALGEIPDAFTYTTAVAPGGAANLIDAYLDRFPDTALVVVDTLGKVMPPAAQGESAYQRDYRVGSALKRLSERQPGLAVVVAHHDRKAGADDFVDAVSGTHGLAGAADTIVVLDRKRQATDALLKITGRDVPEDVYALRVRDGMAWTLDGVDLAAAAATAQRRQDSGALGDRSTEILAFIRSHPDGVAAAKVEAEFGDGTRRYLARLFDAGRLVKPRRGVYALPPTVSQPSQCPEPPTCPDCGWPVDSDHHDTACDRSDRD